MPRPRFDKLPAEKKERILEAAAKEFSTEGFENASLNQILEQAEISKGAAYYYFDDKIDLYLTVVQYYSLPLIETIKQDLTAIEKDTFWESLTDVYRKQFLSVFERPWLFGAMRSVTRLSAEAQQDPRLQTLMNDMLGMAMELFKRGQAMGLIRTDLPDDLLITLLWGIDEVYDNWLLDHWGEFEPEQADFIAGRMVDILKRLFSPVR